MTGAADAIFQSERVFMGQSDSFMAFGFTLNCRYCAVSSTYHAVYCHLLPKTAGLLPPIWRDCPDEIVSVLGDCLYYVIT